MVLMVLLKNNWALLLMVLAIAGSGYISYAESKDTANQIASKAEKRAVAKAAAIIYEATIQGCERDNDRARESNSRVRQLRGLPGPSNADYLAVVDCEKQYARPLP